MVKMMKDATDLTKNQVEDFFAKYAKLVEEALSVGDKVPMPGIGTFQMKEKGARGERQTRNPKTGESITVEAKPAYKTIDFKIPKSVKESYKQVIE